MANPVVGSVALTPGWTTFGEVLPTGAAGRPAGREPGDTDRREDDLAGRVDPVRRLRGPGHDRGHLPDLRVAGPRRRVLTPTVPDAAVRFTIGGTVYTAQLPRVTSNDVWLSGPLVREDRSLVVPVAPDGTPQPYLDVIFDRRSYVNGTTVSTSRSRTPRTRRARAGDLQRRRRDQRSGPRRRPPDHLPPRHPDPVLHDEGAKVFDLGGLVESQETPDFTPFYAANALPRYVSQIANNVDSPTGVALPYSPVANQPKFDILQGGDLDWLMSDHGGRGRLRLTRTGSPSTWSSRTRPRNNTCSPTATSRAPGGPPP